MPETKAQQQQPQQLLKSLSSSSGSWRQSRDKSLVMTAEQVEQSLKAAQTTVRKPKKMYSRDRLMQIARCTDTSRLPVDLDVTRLRDLQDAAVYNQRPSQSTGVQSAIFGMGVNQYGGSGGLQNGGIGSRSWIPNKDAPVFTSQSSGRIPSASQSWWGGGGGGGTSAAAAAVASMSVGAGTGTGAGAGAGINGQWRHDQYAYNQANTRPIQSMPNQAMEKERLMMQVQNKRPVTQQVPNGAAPLRQPQPMTYSIPSHNPNYPQPPPQRTANNVMFPQTRQQPRQQQQYRQPVQVVRPQVQQQQMQVQQLQNQTQRLGQQRQGQVLGQVQAQAQTQAQGQGLRTPPAPVASQGGNRAGGQIDTTTLLAHMKGAIGNYNGQKQGQNQSHISFEDLLRAAKASGISGSTVIGGKTVDEIERSMVNSNNKAGSAQYLLSLLHAASGGTEPPASSAGQADQSDTGRDINRIMEALFSKQPQQQQPQKQVPQSSPATTTATATSSSGVGAIQAVVSAQELERQNIAIAQQHKQSGKEQPKAASALDALLQGGGQQGQRPFIQQSYMPNTEGRVNQTTPQNQSIPTPTPNPVATPSIQPGQNNLDVLLKILQGQSQPQAPVNPNLQQLMMQQQLQQMNQQMTQQASTTSTTQQPGGVGAAAAMRHGNVVTGQRPPFGSVRAQQQSSQLPNFLSGAGSGGLVGGRSPRVNPQMGVNPAAVAPAPPRSISGGGDSDVLQKLLKISRAGSSGGQQQPARVVQG